MQAKQPIYIILLQVLLLLALAVSPQASQAATTVLRDCFTTPANYNIHIDSEIPADENKDGHEVNVDSHLVGQGQSLTANCTCPKNLYSSTIVYEMAAAGSPLPMGTNGYGYLNDHLDVGLIGYSDAINSPDGSNLTSISISSYPTPLSDMSKANEGTMKPTEGNSDVCSDSTRPSDVISAKRGFKWNVIGFTLYVKKAFLGEQNIPATILVQNFACLSFGGYCTISDVQQVSNIWVEGKISAPLSCTINAGSTIEVELGNIVTSQFVAQGQPPSSYTLKDVDITYHCDDPAAADYGKIKFSLSADQGVVAGSNNLIARMLNRDDIGVRMYDQNNNNAVLDGSLDLPVTLDAQGNGKISMKAAPVSTTSKRPQAGKFEGNVTVKMDIR